MIIIEVILALAFLAGAYWFFLVFFPLKVLRLEDKDRPGDLAGKGKKGLLSVIYYVILFILVLLIPIIIFMKT